MKRKLPVLIAIALVIIFGLAACKPQPQPAATGGSATDPLPSHVQQPEPTQPEPPTDSTPAPAAITPAAPAPTEPKLISMDAAIAIALEDAGFTQKDVTGLHAELERDDGITYYDVDFYKGGKEYDYEIHAETGKILEPVKKETSSGSSSSGNASSGNPPASSGNITKDEAISKALAHAGLKKSQVSRLKAELDRDDGVTVYDVEFETADWEYEYEINAKTGNVRKAEKDRND